MGMIGHVRQITPEQLLQLREHPESIPQFLHGRMLADAPKVAAAFRRIDEFRKQFMQSGPTADPQQRDKVRSEILSQLQSAGVKIPGQNPSEEGLSLEKSWHSLHYLLTGSVDAVNTPVGKAILGGKETGPDLGYGPARFLEAGEVREVAAALAKISASDLEGRFDLKAMMKADVYACRDEEELELAQHYLEELKKYYSEAAKRGNPMVLYLD